MSYIKIRNCCKTFLLFWKMYVKPRRFALLFKSNQKEFYLKFETCKLRFPVRHSEMESGFLCKLRIAFEQLSAKKDPQNEIYSCSGHY